MNALPLHVSMYRRSPEPAGFWLTSLTALVAVLTALALVAAGCPLLVAAHARSVASPQTPGAARIMHGDFRIKGDADDPRTLT